MKKSFITNLIIFQNYTELSGKLITSILNDLISNTYISKND